MKPSEDWDWQTAEKKIADIDAWKQRFPIVHELTASSDGEKIAAVVEREKNNVTPCINGELWGETYEKVWSLRFTPDDRLASAVLRNYEWTVAVDGQPWEETYDFIWNMTFSPSGKDIAINMKKDNAHGVAINGESWENKFVEVRDLAVSPDGKRAATRIKTKRIATLDIAGFAGRVLTIAVDGNPWNTNFLGLWGFTFSSDSNHVAAGVQLDHLSFTIAVDGNPWDETFLGIWEPVFRPGSLNAIAPVKTWKGWTLAENGRPIWDLRCVQLWHQRVSPDGQSIAVVIAPEFGEWTVAVDSSPWKRTFRDAVLSPVFSPDGKKVAAVVKENNRYTIAVNSTTWGNDFDMIWDPVFSPDSSTVAARGETNGKYILVVDGNPGKNAYDALWDPVFSPDGEKVLIRCIEDGKYYRKVIKVHEIV